METLPTLTWFWLYVPMAVLILLSIVTFYTERRDR